MLSYMYSINGTDFQKKKQSSKLKLDIVQAIDMIDTKRWYQSIIHMPDLKMFREVWVWISLIDRISDVVSLHMFLTMFRVILITSVPVLSMQHEGLFSLSIHS